MKKIFATAALLLGISSMADAQTVIMNENLTHDGSVVTVSFEVDTDVKDLPSNRRKSSCLIYIMVKTLSGQML